ncbi:MAG: tRNA (adenosine(37)-N6)-threonylcarbamoyltransferase complex ATPase subunit type 1 TsaE [Phycisphaeraceae bacterium]|nr:tRNA (adenosine(37)-N6)-threonylcarbamoyltransferase complex ATPase subunit type 1 TsaE [Phycisphaeraceae bacterium]
MTAHESIDAEGLAVHSPEAMARAGAALAGALQSGDVVAIDGPLGAGKSVLVRGMAEGLSIDPSLVSSPTFVLMQRYAGPGLALVHADAYRVRSPQEFEAVGWSELISEPATITAVEWASRITELLPPDTVTIELDLPAPGEPSNLRRLRLTSSDVAQQSTLRTLLRTALNK